MIDIIARYKDIYIQKDRGRYKDGEVDRSPIDFVSVENLD